MKGESPSSIWTRLWMVGARCIVFDLTYQHVVSAAYGVERPEGPCRQVPHTISFFMLLLRSMQEKGSSVLVVLGHVFDGRCVS